MPNVIAQWKWFFPVVVAGIAMFCLQTVGCERADQQEPQTGNAKEIACDEKLDDLLSGLQPDQLGIAAEARMDNILSQLNDWSRTCGKDVKLTVKLKPATIDLLCKVMPPEELKKIDRQKFDARDARHIRNSILFKQIATFATRESNDEIGRAVDLFYYVIRNIELMNRAPTSVRVPPFRTLLFGRGTAEDRAWLFAELLRQIKIPAVILQPKTDQGDGKPEEQTAPFLVGVVSDQKKIFLFDTRLGLPIPGPKANEEKTPLIRRPATLEEFLTIPGIAKSLNTENFQYAIQPAGLKDARVFLIGQRSTWTLRMKRLQWSLKPGPKPILFDELDADSDGLIVRIVELSNQRWQADEIGVWPYPDATWLAFEQKNEKQDRELLILQRPFGAPMSITVNSNARSVVLSPGTSGQLQSRIKQLMGDFRAAIASFVNVRLNCMKPPIKKTDKKTDKKDQPAAVDSRLIRRWMLERDRVLLQTAEEDASLWTGTCKFEQADYEGVRDHLEGEGHLSRYPNGRRINQCRYLLALTYRTLATSLDQYSRPIVLLRDRISANHPQKHGFEVLANYWDRQRSKSP
ncbi:MAG: transglutaminase family protein [Planctomycetes bacterium]|nr:transglutaminase family protein [Planctomycetota bacterium]